MNNKIEIQRINIVELDTDAIVNAANRSLLAGGGVCGAIFRAAGNDQLAKACDAIGYCETGSAVITPGFQMKAKYIIHAVGPVWSGGNSCEAVLLYSAYNKSLELAVENGCHSIGFPLISAGIYGYPVEQAWTEALYACMDFQRTHPKADLRIIFAVLKYSVLRTGLDMIETLEREYR